MRTRFAPSPTGGLHLGSVRTALFNYLFAKSRGGEFILRIEDTDQARTVPGSVAQIAMTLRSLKLQWDLGPSAPTTRGAHDPSDLFVQSNRLAIYDHHIQILLESGCAYRCFCTPQRLDQLRKHAPLGAPYDRHCAHHSVSEARARIEHGELSTVRLRMPDRVAKFRDLVLGDVRGDSNASRRHLGHLWFQDPILLKSDGFPTYHFASVVDDHLMDISHVVRGQEWLASTGKHLALYNAFNWCPPAFAHVPLLIHANGSKLSKRDGDGFIDKFIAHGYLTESILNFIALMGWSPKSDRKDTLSINDMINLFSISDLTKSPAQINYSKLDHFNNWHIRQLCKDKDGLERLVQLCIPFFTADPKYKALVDSDTIQDKIRKVLPLIEGRPFSLEQVPQDFSYLFVRPNFADSSFLETVRKSVSMTEFHMALDKTCNLIQSKAKWNPIQLEVKIKDCTMDDLPARKILKSVRLALTGTTVGLSLPKIMEFLGKDECVERLQQARNCKEQEPFSVKIS